MTELGKSAKHMGVTHPRDLRKTDPVPLRATPKAVKRPKALKPYGFEYQHREVRWKQEGRRYSFDGYYDWKWRENWSWYETPKQRDQALSAWRKQHAGYRKDSYGEARPVDRATDS